VASTHDPQLTATPAAPTTSDIADISSAPNSARILGGSDVFFSMIDAFRNLGIARAARMAIISRAAVRPAGVMLGLLVDIMFISIDYV